MTMTPQQLQRSAAALDKSGVLEDVAEGLRLQTFRQWMATDPDDTAARERLFFFAYALENIMGSISSLAVPDETGL